MKQQKKRQTKLSNKLLIAVALFSVILFLSITVFLSFNHYYSEMQELSDTAFAYARSASWFIDGDKILGYLEKSAGNETGDLSFNVDDYYTDVMLYLMSIRQENALMKYYYVFVPNEDTVTYVWDANTGDDASKLGDTEEYMDGGKEAVERIFNDHPEEKLSVYKDETWGSIACAFYPIYTSDNRPVAVVGVDLSMEGIRTSFMGYILTIITVMVGVMALASIIFFLRIKKSLIKPINKLNDATKQLVENLDSDKTFTIDIHTRDELEELARSFGKMDKDLKAYIKELSAVTAEKERIGAELNVAAQIQADMLPRIFPPFPEKTSFDIFASMTPAKEVGGDFYDFFFVDNDRLALVMADVSGKGVPAALFMVIAKTLIKNRAMMGDSPAQVLQNVNEQLCEGNDAELFVTVWLAIIDLNTGKGLAANAGHEHPALKRKDGSFELIVYRHSPAVATMPGLQFKEHAFELKPGDDLFVYTDGVPEATNAAGELYGNKRMLEALNESASSDPKELLTRVKARVDGFVGDAPQFDDVTMLCLHYEGQKQAKAEEPMDELSLDASEENLNAVLAFIDERLARCSCTPKTQMQIDLAAEEIFVNIARYAYAPKTGKATVRFEKIEENAVKITFIDSGTPYDPLKKEDPDVTLPAEKRAIGGLGVFLVKKNTDDVRYSRENGCNVLSFVKKI